jgi:hypothetical protein
MLQQSDGPWFDSGWPDSPVFILPMQFDVMWRRQQWKANVASTTPVAHAFA